MSANKSAHATAQPPIVVKWSEFEMLKEHDANPDLSWLGEYSNQRKAKNSIDRKAEGDMERNQYRFFTPTQTAEETGNPNSESEDYKRMEQFQNGSVCMIGIRAQATIKIPLNGSTYLQTFKSPGVWSIESDSGDEYFKEVFGEECALLAEMIASLAGVEVVDDREEA